MRRIKPIVSFLKKLLINPKVFLNDKEEEVEDIGQSIFDFSESTSGPQTEYFNFDSLP
jgi:hypothetical protein